MSTEPIDLGIVIAQHQPARRSGWCEACTAERWPCLPYRLAELAQGQQAALVRVRALNDQFLELRDRTEGWNEAKPLRVSPAEAFERCARAVRTALDGGQS